MDIYLRRRKLNLKSLINSYSYIHKNFDKLIKLLPTIEGPYDIRGKGTFFVNRLLFAKKFRKNTYCVKKI